MTHQNNKITTCLCGSGKSYVTCCRPYHKGSKLPDTALELMRSRYVAYALNIPDYLIKTTHPASPYYHYNLFSWKNSLSRFSKSHIFHRLEIIDAKEEGNTAAVIFVAHLSQDGEDHSFSEISYFDKVERQWLYKWGHSTNGTTPLTRSIEQVTLLPLAYYGEPVLTQKAAIIPFITEEIKELVNRMIKTMDACNGLGLAAPQVHHSIQLFIIRTPSEGDDELILGPVQVFINPIVSPILDSGTWSASEGCLSIPAIHADVERPKSILVEYTDLLGQRHKRTVSGWEARVISHEYDHLQGILFLDHLAQKKKETLEPLLQKLQKRISGILSP